MGHRDPGKNKWGLEVLLKNWKDTPRIVCLDSAWEPVPKDDHIKLLKAVVPLGEPNRPETCTNYFVFFFCCALTGTDSDAFLCKCITHEKARDRYCSLAGTPRNKGSDLHSKPR